jgi:hypothetical protein
MDGATAPAGPPGQSGARAAPCGEAERSRLDQIWRNSATNARNCSLGQQELCRRDDGTLLPKTRNAGGSPRRPARMAPSRSRNHRGGPGPLHLGPCLSGRSRPHAERPAAAARRRRPAAMARRAHPGQGESQRPSRPGTSGNRACCMTGRSESTRADRLLTVSQAADVLGTTERFPRRLIEQRRITEELKRGSKRQGGESTTRRSGTPRARNREQAS